MADQAAVDDRAAPTAPDPLVVIRSRPYLSALVLAASSASRSPPSRTGSWPWSTRSRTYLFADLPQDLFTGPVPAWWPIPFCRSVGLLVGLTIRYLPGNGGHSPAFGFKTGGGRRSTVSCPASCSPRWPRSAWAPCSAPRRR